MEGLRAILFDFGGTLDGPGEPWVDRFAAAYRRVGVPVGVDELRAAAGYATRHAYHTPDIARFSLRQTVGFHVGRQFAHLKMENPLAADAIVAYFLDRTAAALAESRAVLARLAARFQLGVISNFYGNVERILADAGFASLLATVVDSTVVGVSKPDPGIFALATERLGVDPAHALFVGDSLEQDITPAHHAGLRTAWVTSRTGACKPPPDLRVRRLGELEHLI
ncbi:MAG TPA: HAD family hydrolase [Candidatus Kryptonia bacterium]|nr:HAD family hydrolase [Candidatus Kryptonia bacterium]